eukprot:CAMPEP_0198244080 /NCGR_PEP_ID=MMETSP1446-20131203/32836_1 /TAXON_ID=1461542 ORGANISM="Unidentified sp, Strain CCMP2111" /NCGR_SAMPLE_ID=MMETSP1446 /ASSEMBLY_ACC=CAM_ASM_001112 /LENGTH=387 /DNA_ID=CAMNT_0043928043 /DNA_START=66 /DNA_END=1229 /DNA_ORIENTATION=-
MASGFKGPEACALQLRGTRRTRGWVRGSCAAKEHAERTRVCQIKGEGVARGHSQLQHRNWNRCLAALTTHGDTHLHSRVEDKRVDELDASRLLVGGKVTEHANRTSGRLGFWLRCFVLPSSVGLACIMASSHASAGEVLMREPVVNLLLPSWSGQDIGAALFSLVGSLILVRSLDNLAERGVVGKNSSRKLIHILCGPLFCASWALFSPDPSARWLSAMVPLAQAVRLLLIGSGVWKDPAAVKSISRTNDRSELLRGPLYYTLALALATSAFWRQASGGVLAVSLMCGGDGMADVIGRKWGSGSRMSFNPAKSWVGSGAMLVAGFALSFALLTLHGQLTGTEDWLKVFAIALACTTVEALPINRVVDDNITVPGLAMVLGALLLPSN